MNDEGDAEFVPPLCKGKPRAQEVVLATSGVGWVERWGREALLPPLPLLTKEGETMNVDGHDAVSR